MIVEGRLDEAIMADCYATSAPPLLSSLVLDKGYRLPKITGNPREENRLRKGIVCRKEWMLSMNEQLWEWPDCSAKPPGSERNRRFNPRCR